MLIIIISKIYICKTTWSTKICTLHYSIFSLKGILRYSSIVVCRYTALGWFQAGCNRVTSLRSGYFNFIDGSGVWKFVLKPGLSKWLNAYSSLGTTGLDNLLHHYMTEISTINKIFSVFAFFLSHGTDCHFWPFCVSSQ